MDLLGASSESSVLPILLIFFKMPIVPIFSVPQLCSGTEFSFHPQVLLLVQFLGETQLVNKAISPCHCLDSLVNQLTFQILQ